MPTAHVPGGQDWEPVNAGKGAIKATTVPKTAREVTALKEKGLVVTEKKFGAGTNSSAHSSTVMSARKLEEADDVGTIAKVDKSLSIAIMQARTAKKLTQKELATAINEKPQVVAEYESGKAVPNGQIIAKLERHLGVKLPRSAVKSKPPPKAGATTGTGMATRSTTAGGATAKQAAVTRGGPPKRR